MGHVPHVTVGDSLDAQNTPGKSPVTASERPCIVVSCPMGSTCYGTSPLLPDLALRFHIPLVKPDVRISRIRLSLLSKAMRGYRLAPLPHIPDMLRSFPTTSGAYRPMASLLALHAASYVSFRPRPLPSAGFPGFRGNVGLSDSQPDLTRPSQAVSSSASSAPSPGWVSRVATELL
jgi:hypothetical protein